MEKPKSEALKAFSKVDPFKICEKAPGKLCNLGKKLLIIL
jgi:hypothetical protein